MYPYEIVFGMNLYDILLLKTLVKVSGGGSADLTEIIKELETKVTKEEMEVYITQAIDELPTISEEELNSILV